MHTSNNASNQKLFSLIENFGGSSRSAASTHMPAQTTHTAPTIQKKQAVKQSTTKTAPPNKKAKAIAKNFFSVSQAAKLLKKDVATIRRWCESGKLKAKKINGVWRIDRATIGKQKK